jgi:hypothetical protein
VEDPALIRRLLAEAEADPIASESRLGLCRTLALVFTESGALLWVGGYLIGPDRKEGASPFGFGNDATVGLATVAQVAGQLAEGIAQLLDSDNRYAACALLRQIVEVEYLAWAFAENQEEAAAWLRATRENRLRMWQPRHLRDRSAGRFRARDYGHHCELGGHPTPEARVLLPGRDDEVPSAFWWVELATHGLSAWEYLLVGAEHAGYGAELRGVAKRNHLPEAAASWRETDRVAMTTMRAIRPSD